jgi:hypothetical protein
MILIANVFKINAILIVCPYFYVGYIYVKLLQLIYNIHCN